MDAAFRLFVLFASQEPKDEQRYSHITRHFRNLETEYETGEPVLPGWASIGNVAAHYESDDSDPFAAPVTEQ